MKVLKHRRVISIVVVLVVLTFLVPHYAWAAMNVSVTRQYSPSANAAITSGAGDNDGFQTTPANAYADDTSVATDTNSGFGDNSVPTSAGTDKHNYYNFGISIPSGSTINGIQVRADISVDSLTNAPYTAIRLSWDGGTSWTTEKSITLTGTAETTYNYGNSSDTWGRTWSATEFTNGNFRVQVINGDTGSPNNRDFSLDWIPVSITFTAPWDSYEDSGRTTIRDTFQDTFNIVYMKGTGYPTGNYTVSYYDAGANGGQKIYTESNISVNGSGILNSMYNLTSNPGVTPGTWHALVQPYSGYTPFPTDYNTAVGAPDTYGILGNDSFTVEASAIPELPTVIAGIAVAAACFGIYYWMRRRRLKHVKA